MKPTKQDTKMMNATTQSRSSCPIWESRKESGSRPYNPEGRYVQELLKRPWAGATNIEQQLGAAAADRLQIAAVQVAAPLQPQASIAPPTTKKQEETKKIQAC
ncbi:uncharacterized protein LOC6725093 [Drosophila simulans]|nr:uncharacterized protein LOC6725093 [Drosophila simulans]XP_044779613.1 uncharacterized protein LOC6725093 [Drosophila simulans]XP_044779614.1 uncharacterized protein LOC6725093 [Drosophila simulans]XP_044779615.1 uncharacterized protein LOC6725093 [Drosophila simulans]KMZ08156.1 uncharacterized protein Dsimw501_GD16689, isoform B [Drosophila simulans]KMZ08157.1 uncharacterized protein Dsimw501_GD16689, isoform D [Drosophila simulans]KMZ08158.1 uncharacterized protein Dsimw501_GD16689, isof